MFDKGVDFDLYQLDKSGDAILFAWTSWFEGELKTSSTAIDKLEQQFNVKFKFGTPQRLNKKNIVEEMKICWTLNNCTQHGLCCYAG